MIVISQLFKPWSLFQKKEKKKKRSAVNYPNIPSAICPLPHSNELPIPIPPESYSIDSDDESKSSTSDDISYLDRPHPTTPIS